MIYETHILSNGLRIIHRPFPSQISYCGVAVNTGTRDEYADEFGMAHFVEHMLFKGTKKRKAHHIANRMENVGGELNAYTTKEETFLYAGFLEEYFPRAVELLSDVVFNSEFNETQIDREREVILDEINSYHDSPAELIYDDFENLLFAGHEMGHNILGEPESLQCFDTKRVRNFVARQYQPQQMVFFSFGKTSFGKVVRLTEKYFSHPALRLEVKKRVAPTETVSQRLVMKKNTAQSHVMMGTRGYDIHHPQRYTLYLLNNILGGGNLNSRLNNSLREKNGLVYNVESNVTFYSDTGVFAVYFACDPRYTEKCNRLVKKEFEKLCNIPLSTQQLSIAKKQWKGQIGIASENNENTSLGMAKSFLRLNKYASFDEVFAKIDVITGQEIQEVAREIFQSNPLLELRYT